jgi:hypothetical protein
LNGKSARAVRTQQPHRPQLPTIGRHQRRYRAPYMRRIRGRCSPSCLASMPSPYHLGARRSIEVIDAGRRTLTVIYGRCRTVRLLHFAAALPNPPDQAPQQAPHPRPSHFRSADARPYPPQHPDEHPPADPRGTPADAYCKRQLAMTVDLAAGSSPR